MFGAEGIGLCRTEHMFFKEERLPVLRRMILADDEKERREALERILLFQKSDFKRMFETMGDRPVNIRLLDPMLHEFIPQSDEEIHVLADQFDVSYDLLAARVEEVQLVDEQQNPPFGLSNYFMLNVIAENKMPRNPSSVSGIPSDWNRSVYNTAKGAQKALAASKIGRASCRERV